jgi:hypothetical protein
MSPPRARRPGTAHRKAVPDAAPGDTVLPLPGLHAPNPASVSPARADLRGAARLAKDATIGLTDLVEAMHERIARVPGRPAPTEAGRTSGITGLVYKTIRGVTHVVGGSVDGLLAALVPALSPVLPPARSPALAGTEPWPHRDAIVAALNGVLGDHLVRSHNPLATPMSLRHQGQAVLLERAELAAHFAHSDGRLVLLLHGLCMNDLQWTRDGHDHGAALQRDMGLTPLYLRYNSGQPVSVNGLALAKMLEHLVSQWPVPLQRLVLVCHSMGGLLARSALHQAAACGHTWPARLNDMVFLGTPHHGAPLERAGNWVDILLGGTPYAAPLARLGKVRSAGITDLRHGNLLATDAAGHDRFARRADSRQPVPLPTGVRCFTVAARWDNSGSARTAPFKDRFIGDGLVPLASALGQHPDPARCLAFAPSHQWVGSGIHHLQLLSDAQVYAQVRGWLAAV